MKKRFNPLNLLSHVALCSPLEQMYTNKNTAKEYCEMALAAADPLYWSQENKTTTKNIEKKGTITTSHTNKYTVMNLKY